jgi:hypothetical protein
MKKPNYDLKMFQEIKQFAEFQKGEYAQRNNYFDEVDKIFLMDSTEIQNAFKTLKGAKLTLHPRPRNKALGAIRLLTLVDPEFSIPTEFQGKDIDKADKLERFILNMYKMAGKLRGDPLSYDIARSAEETVGCAFHRYND